MLSQQEIKDGLKARTIVFREPQDIEDFKNYELKNVDDCNFYIKSFLTSYSLEMANNLVEIIKNLNSHGYEAKLHIQVEGFNFQGSDLENLILVDDELRKNYSELVFVEADGKFNINQVLNAYEHSNEFLKVIKKLDASPFEKYLMIYNFVTSFAYKDNEIDSAAPRTVIGVLNGTDIVCVGYSNLLKHLCDMVGIKCEIQHVSVSDSKGKFLGLHQSNIVYLKDEKYGIDGWFYVDSCWDALGEKEESFLKYNHCLIPVGDVKNTSREVSIPEFDFLYADKKEEEMFYESMFKDWEYTDGVELCLKLCTDVDFEKIENLFKNEAELKRLKERATKIVKEAFEKEKVPSEIYNQNFEFMPRLFPYRMIAYCMSDAFDEKVLKKWIVELKQYCHERMIEENVDGELISDFVDIENIYNEFKNVLQFGETAEISNDLLYEEMILIECCEKAKEKMLEIKTNNASVDVETFKNGLKNSNIILGMSEYDAEVQAKRAVENTVKRSRRYFNKNATNCFALELNQKRKTN